ncbi:MAG: hypothetical protein IT550_06450 [Novosphingobium sp.]|nr:hypothetical protein [Novosphingobium sp.]
MFLTLKSRRPALFSRSAMAVSLALGVVGGGFVAATPALAAKQSAPKMSPEFQKVVIPLNQAVEAAKKRADVVAAKGNAATLGSLLAAEKAQLDQAFAAISTPDDRLVFGQVAVGLGGLAEDPAIQRRGIQAMLESGKANPADVPRLQFFAGSLAYQARDYGAARTALQAAITSGYRDNDAEALLAEAYMADNQAAQGLNILMQAIEARRATGTPAPENWYRRGLGAAYKAKLLDQVANFSLGLVQAYPSTANWGGAITIVREIGRFPAQETLDLMRLMARTSSYGEERDYIEYIQAADARRLPGEVQKVIEAGVASGKLRASDQFVAEARTISNERIAADRASLVGLERDARAANATAATAAGAGDAFLSYGDAAKAEALYTIALAKPGVDTARVLTRLGIAQVDLGKAAEAKASFDKVDGPRQPIARLWAIYAAQKAGGADVAPR